MNDEAQFYIDKYIEGYIRGQGHIRLPRDLIELGTHIETVSGRKGTIIGYDYQTYIILLDKEHQYRHAVKIKHPITHEYLIDEEKGWRADFNKVWYEEEVS